MIIILNRCLNCSGFFQDTCWGTNNSMPEYLHIVLILQWEVGVVIKVQPGGWFSNMKELLHKRMDTLKGRTLISG